MAKYTLHYFDLRGRAELTRLIFAVADVEYIDHRMNGQEWQTLKPKAPTGQLPCMEVDVDAKTLWLGQSMAIARYVAAQHGLIGKTNYENARADSVVDSTVDLLEDLLKHFLEKDETKKAEMQKRLDEEILPKYMKMFEKLLADNPAGQEYFSGNKLTWADLAVFNIFHLSLKGNDKALDSYPKLKANYEKVSNNEKIVEHLKKRPVTSF